MDAGFPDCEDHEYMQYYIAATCAGSVTSMCYPSAAASSIDDAACTCHASPCATAAVTNIAGPEVGGNAGFDSGDTAGGARGATTTVRVVQISNPVLVETDVANFRSLVQRLTGKSGCSLKYWNKLRKLSSTDDVKELSATAHKLPRRRSSHDRLGHQHRNHSSPDMTNDSNNSDFTELDVHAALISDGPLPDISMLPPLNLFPPSTNLVVPSQSGLCI